MTNIYQIKKFDPSSIRNTGATAIIGKRACGKTTLVKDILKHKEITQNIVIDPTSDYQQNYNNIVPNEFIHQEYRPEIIKNIIDRQKNLFKNGNPDSIRLIMDSCDQHFKDSKIREIFFNGRCYSIDFLFTLQTMIELSPPLRSNIDYLFIFPSSISARDMKIIYESVSHLFESYEHFYTVVNQCTQNNCECLVIDYVSESDKLEDKLFWYKAEIYDENSLENETDNNDGLFTYAFNLFRYMFCL